MRIIHFPIYVVQPYERGIQETLGRYARFIQPGPGCRYRRYDTDRPVG